MMFIEFIAAPNAGTFRTSPIGKVKKICCETSLHFRKNKKTDGKLVSHYNIYDDGYKSVILIAKNRLVRWCAGVCVCLR